MIGVTIDGVDRTDSVDFNSITIDSALTRRRTTASFQVTTHSGRTYTPRVGNEVIIDDAGTTIFGGVITEIVSQPSAYAIIHHKIKCQDYSRLLDRKLVPDIYEEQTVNDIVSDMKTKYFPSGFTTNNVSCPVNINYVAFNYKQLWLCLEHLAEVAGYELYVDKDKDVHFMARDAMIAPFELNDDDGSYIYNSLVIRQDNTQVRNVITVRGGDYLAPQTTVEMIVDPTLHAYDTKYRFSDIAVSVTADLKSVGIENIHTYDNFDVLYSFPERRIVFQEGKQPTDTLGTIKVSGKPNLPVIIKYRSQPHIDAMKSVEGGSGVYEYLVKDNSLDTKEGAKQRARAEVDAYANTLSEAEFETYQSGLAVGQRITVNSASRGIVGEEFFINKINIRPRTNDSQFVYRVSLITTRTFDLIDVLQKLIQRGNEDIVIEEGEIVNLYESFTDNVYIQDSVVASTTGGTYRWQPTTDPIAAVWNNFEWA